MAANVYSLLLRRVQLLLQTNLGVLQLFDLLRDLRAVAALVLVCILYQLLESGVTLLDAVNVMLVGLIVLLLPSVELAKLLVGTIDLLLDLLDLRARSLLLVAAVNHSSSILAAVADIVVAGPAAVHECASGKTALAAAITITGEATVRSVEGDKRVTVRASDASAGASLEAVLVSLAAAVIATGGRKVRQYGAKNRLNKVLSGRQLCQ